MPQQRMLNSSRLLEMILGQDHKPSVGIKYFLKAEPMLKTDNAVDDHQQHGEMKPVSYTHLDVYKRQPHQIMSITGVLAGSCLLYTSRCV